MSHQSQCHTRIQILSNGFSLLELMITTSVFVILTGVAIPSFASMIENKRIQASSKMLASTLSLSRNHAISTGKTVIVCHSKDPSFAKCSESRKRNTSWSNGIISYADENNNGNLDSTDKILRTMELNDHVSVVFNQNGRLRFFSNGGSRSAGFYLCSELSKQERHLKILYTGRTRVVAKMNKYQRSTCLSKSVRSM